MIDVHGLLVLELQHFVIALCLTTGISLVAGYSGFRYLRRARWIEDTPTSRIRSAAQGLVELNGRCEAGGQPLLVSRLGRVPCLWYSFTVEQYRRSGKRSHWSVVERGGSERPFMLRDDTGHCWIEPAGAEVHPRQRRRWEGQHRWPEGGTGTWLGRALGQRYRYTEQWLAEGEQLYALGWFESRGEGREAVDQQGIARDMIARWKRDYPGLLARFDLDRDGRLDPQEWGAVQAAAAQAAAGEVAVLQAAPLEHRLGRPPHRGLPFVLSDHHEEHLSRRLRWRSAGNLTVMAVAGTCAVLLWTALA